MPTREYKNPDTMSRPAGYTHIVDEVHQGSNPPTSTLLVVSALANPDFMVEIEAIAVVD